MVAFGSKTGKSIRDDIKKASGGNNGLWTVQAGKDMRVRFLEDPEEWTKFLEHYSQGTKFFPCTQDDTCQGCNSDNDQLKRASTRYAANVLDVKNARVIPLKMPIDLANRVINKCDRNGGTLLNRDFTLIRTGTGMNDTVYDVENEDRTEIDISRYRKDFKDIIKVLEDIYTGVWGDQPKTGVSSMPRQEDDKPPF